AGAAERPPALGQKFERGLIAIEARALIDRTLVPIETQPFQIAHQLAVGAGHVPLEIDVFDAEQDVAPMPARIQPSGEHGARDAEVHLPRRAGRKTPDVCQRRFIHAMHFAISSLMRARSTRPGWPWPGKMRSNS